MLSRTILPRPYQHQGQLIFNLNLKIKSSLKILLTCQSTKTGINARRHTQKLKSGKAKRNAKKKKCVDAGFVNMGRIAYRSEGES